MSETRHWLMDWRKLVTLTLAIEVIATGVNVWALWMKWNAVWWVFVVQAFSLAAVCGAAALAMSQLWRHRPK
jgi:hypothetical protein